MAANTVVIFFVKEPLQIFCYTITMIRLYQVGDVSMHLHHDPEDYKLSDSGKSLELAFSPRLARPQTQYMPKPRTVKIDGILLDNCSETQHETKNRLNRLIGLETDFIGYVAWDHCVDSSCCSCCACSTPGHSCQLIWFHNRGVLKDVSLKGTKANEITLTVEHNSYWKTINNAIWEFVPFRKYRTLETLTFDSTNFVKPLPDCETIFNACDGCWQWVKRVYSTPIPMYDPATYLSIVDELRPGYPKGYRIHDWDSGTKYKNVWIDEAIWNAPPLSIYQFRGVEDRSTLEFTVRRTNAVWTSREDTVIIDLDGLNTRLVADGLLPISAGDRIVVGDVRHLPGLVIRADGTIVDTVQIPVSYSGLWPGMLETGENEILFGNAESFDGYGQGDRAFSSLHIFRRL